MSAPLDRIVEMGFYKPFTPRSATTEIMIMEIFALHFVRLSQLVRVEEDLQEEDLQVVEEVVRSLATLLLIFLDEHIHLGQSISYWILIQLVQFALIVLAVLNLLQVLHQELQR